MNFAKEMTPLIFTPAMPKKEVLSVFVDFGNKVIKDPSFQPAFDATYKDVWDGNESFLKDLGKKEKKIKNRT